MTIDVSAVSKQMVERIPECAAEAVRGLQAELKAVVAEQEPLARELAGLRGALAAVRAAAAADQTGTGGRPYKQLMEKQQRALELCRQQAHRQHRQLQTSTKTRQTGEKTKPNQLIPTKPTQTDQLNIKPSNPN